MNKAVLDQMWDQFRQKYGVYLRLLEAFPADKLATHPVAGMRTPAELVAHVCGVSRDDGLTLRAVASQSVAAVSPRPSTSSTTGLMSS